MQKIYAGRILLAGLNVVVSSVEESSFNETVGTYNAACAKKYHVDDMNAIRQKIGMQ